MQPVQKRDVDQPWIEAWCKPAGKCGGDFVIRDQTPDQVTVVLGDATGHGEAAAHVADFAQRLIEHELRAAPLDVLLRRWHSLIHREFSTDCRFVCITILRLDLKAHRLAIVNCGNPEVLIRRAGGRWIERFASTGMPLGIVDETEWRSPTIEYTRLGPSECAFCVSDGVTDCVGTDGERFGLNRVCAVARFINSYSPLRALRQGLLRFRSLTAVQDDLSLVVLGMRPAVRHVA